MDIGEQLREVEGSGSQLAQDAADEIVWLRADAELNSRLLTTALELRDEARQALTGARADAERLRQENAKLRLEIEQLTAALQEIDTDRCEALAIARAIAHRALTPDD